MPLPPEPDWRIQNNGHEHGPYPRVRILEMLARGELPETAAIRPEGMEKWLPVPKARQLLASATAKFAANAVPPSGPMEAPAPVEEPFGSPAAAPVLAPVLAPKGKKLKRRSYAPLIYTALVLAVLAAMAWWSLGRGDPVGEAGYAKVKAELVARMDAWRDRGIRLESVPAEEVDGPLARYAIDPPAAPVGAKDTAYAFVVRCTFRDAHGVETQSTAKVTMEGKRLRFWDLFSK